MCWSTLDEDIDVFVNTCRACSSGKDALPNPSLNPWIWLSRPWSSIHVEFAGPLLGKTYFVVVDAHSKWPEVLEMSST